MRRIPNPARDRLIVGGSILGSFTFSPDPAHTEIMAEAGFDFVMIDQEHAPLTSGDVQAHIRAAQASGISPFVRVRHSDVAEVGRLLDMGVQGIMFPNVALHPNDRRDALDALRYAPAGTRPSCSGVRAVQYGATPLADYAERSNADVVSIGPIEDQVVVDRIDGGLDEYPLDIVVPGSGDIATSLGVAGQHTHPRVIESLEKVIQATKPRSSAKIGIYLADPGTAGRWRDMGVDFFLASVD